MGGETARWAEVTARLASSQLQLLKHLHRNTQGVSSGVISAQCNGETNTAFVLSLWNLQVVVRDSVSKKNTFVLISARQGNQAVQEGLGRGSPQHTHGQELPLCPPWEPPVLSLKPLPVAPSLPSSGGAKRHQNNYIPWQTIGVGLSRKQNNCVGTRNAQGLLGERSQWLREVGRKTRLDFYRTKWPLGICSMSHPHGSLLIAGLEKKTHSRGWVCYKAWNL